MADNNDKIDLIRALHFIWKNKRIYIISMITCISLAFIYCVYIIPDTYESTAVLYYPERAGDEAESVSERDLMDDAVEILRQKRMLAIVEDRTGSRDCYGRRLRKCDRGVFAKGQKEGKYKLISPRVKTPFAGNTVSIS